MAFLRRHIANNFGLKIVSLAIAVLLWLAVTREPVAEIAFNVPIEFRNAPEKLEISSETIPQAQVRVRGPVRLVRALSPSEVHAVIDLTGAMPPERTYDLSPKRIRVPGDIEVVQVVPSEFRLSFDQRGSRQVEVMPRVIGTFAAGYRLADVITDPKVITVVGPAHHVDNVETAITDPVDATGVVGRATFLTHAYIADPLVRQVNPAPIHVTVVTEKSRAGSH